MNTTTAPEAIFGAEFGLRLDILAPGQADFLKKQLTIKTKPWDPSEEPRTVVCWREAGGYLWMPRNFRRAAFAVLSAQQRVLRQEPRHEVFDLTKCRFDPERDQDESIPATLAYLQEHGDGVLVSPTGSGKTFIGLYVGAALGLPIGWPVYASHMEDNVRDHIHLIGLTDDDIGVVKGDRCDLGKPVTIMYVQSLLARTYDPVLYSQFGIIVCDEVNRHGAPEWKRTLELFSAQHRLGMSADPRRKDGLGPIIGWTFGGVAHVAKRIVPEGATPPTVVAFNWRRTYTYESYCRWKPGADGWSAGQAHPSKYDKKLAKDQERNKMLMTEVMLAISSGRQILCLSRFVSHLVHCRTLLRRMLHPMGALDQLARLKVTPALTDIRMLRQGLKESQRREVYRANVQFATFKMASDALNVPSLDTLFFLTPPGDPLQPGGRLRWKDEGFDRRPLLIGDCFEATDYAKGRLRWRRDKYRSLGMSFKEVGRNPGEFK